MVEDSLWQKFSANNSQRFACNATFQRYKFASLNLRDNQRYSKASCISARNKTWL